MRMRLSIGWTMLPTPFSTDERAVRAEQLAARFSPRPIGVIARIHHQLQAAPGGKAQRPIAWFSVLHSVS
jgi:hypothetical protein